MRGDMANIDLPFTRHDKDARGNVRWYYLRGDGKKVRLNPKGVEIGSALFFENYQKAHKNRNKVIAQVAHKAGTLGHMIGCYLASPEFHDLRPSTQKVRRNVLKRLIEEHGHRAAQMTVAAARAGRDQRRDRPGAANDLIKVLSALFNWGIDAGLADYNPTLGVKRLKSGPGFATWTRDQIQQYRVHWPVGTRERLALELLYGTGQRRSDVAMFGPQHIAGSTIRLTQQKTGRPLVLPITKELAEALRKTAPDSPFSFLGYKNGDTLGHMFARWCTAAGLPSECRAHGLRKARATHLAEAGATAHEIAAVTGHRSLSQIEVYTRAVDQERLARQAYGEQNVPGPHPILETGTNSKDKNQ